MDITRCQRFQHHYSLQAQGKSAAQQQPQRDLPAVALLECFHSTSYQNPLQ